MSKLNVLVFKLFNLFIISFDEGVMRGFYLLFMIVFLRKLMVVFIVDNISI